MLKVFVLSMVVVTADGENHTMTDVFSSLTACHAHSEMYFEAEKVPMADGTLGRIMGVGCVEKVLEGKWNV